MKKTSYAVKLDYQIKEKVQNFCRDHGLKQSYFVEEALNEKLERETALEDSLEFKKWRHQEGLAVGFDKYLSGRKHR